MHLNNLSAVRYQTIPSLPALISTLVPASIVDGVVYCLVGNIYCASVSTSAKYNCNFPTSFIMTCRRVLKVVLCVLPSAVLSQTSLYSAVTSSLYFPYETIQLTEANVASLGSDDASSFGFAGDYIGFASQCKTFPTDPSWPSAAKWEQLNTYTGGALIKTIPLAAPCYPGPLYDADRCTYIAANWENSSLQYATSSLGRLLAANSF